MDPSLAENVEIRDDTIVCEISCAFGTDQGLWQLTASAPGYRPEARAFQVSYREFDGGCPSFDRGSTMLNLILHPRSE